MLRVYRSPLRGLCAGSSRPSIGKASMRSEGLREAPMKLSAVEYPDPPGYPSSAVLRDQPRRVFLDDSAIQPRIKV